MVPFKDYAEGELLQRGGGSLFNILCACCVSSLFWKKHNLYAFAILMWSATAFIQESVAIILDVINGLPFDWSFVVAEGVPVSIVLCISVVFLFVGSGLFLRLLAIAGVRTFWPLTRLIALCVLAISPFFVISLIYAGLFLVSDQDNWVLSKSIALGASIALSLIFSLLFKPLYPVLERFLPIRDQVIKLSHIGLSTAAAFLFLLFCTIFYN
jgi:hypothetical protein